MDWMPFYLTITSAAFLVPMLLTFQRNMGKLDKQRRICASQMKAIENAIRRFAEEEEAVKVRIEAAKAELAGVQQERDQLERKFNEAKKQYAESSE